MGTKYLSYTFQSHTIKLSKIRRSHAALTALNAVDFIYQIPFDMVDKIPLRL